MLRVLITIETMMTFMQERNGLLLLEYCPCELETKFGHDEGL